MSEDTITAAELLAEREDVFELTRLDMWRRYVDQPDRAFLTFGEGSPAQETQKGNAAHPFYGIVVLNPTGKTIYIGFGAGTAQGSPLFCPPGTALVWPAKFTESSFAVSAADAAGPPAQITVLRLQYPPEPSVHPFGSASASVVTATSPRSVAVGVVSGAVLAVNVTRRGLSIQNTGKAAVSLGLGAAAVIGDDLVLEPGGSWDGTISGLLWRGAINSISAEAGTLAVLEV